jgi:hypothetical protein
MNRGGYNNHNWFIDVPMIIVGMRRMYLYRKVFPVNLFHFNTVVGDQVARNEVIPENAECIDL